MPLNWALVGIRVWADAWPVFWIRSSPDLVVESFSVLNSPRFALREIQNRLQNGRTGCHNVGRERSKIPQKRGTLYFGATGVWVPPACQTNDVHGGQKAWAILTKMFYTFALYRNRCLERGVVPNSS